MNRILFAGSAAAVLLLTAACQSKDAETAETKTTAETAKVEETVAPEPEPDYMSYREAVEHRCSENVQKNLISPSSYKLISIKVLNDETIEITDAVRAKLLAKPKYDANNEKAFMDGLMDQSIRKSRLENHNPTSYREISYVVAYDASNSYGAVLRGQAFCILEGFLPQFIPYGIRGRNKRS